jgi:hypothetical protein
MKTPPSRANADDSYTALGPRSRSGRLVWSQSSAKLSSAHQSGDLDDLEADDNEAHTPTATVVVPPPRPAAPKAASKAAQLALAHRLADVRRHFPGALCADDLLSRVEHQLSSRFGFSGRNAIAVCNLCRDEATAVLRDRIEEAWGGAFTTSGLGGVLTCGVTGFKAGLSHAPVCADSKRERYVFFSFPHIAIDAEGHVGHISRPGRPEASHACGALLKVMGELRKEEDDEIKLGAAEAMKVPGSAANDNNASGGGGGGGGSPSKASQCVHCGAAPPHSIKAAEAATIQVCNLDPEYSILKGRIDGRLAEHPSERRAALERKESALVAVTKAAERAITADLERLVTAAVDPAKADYAVITGVEVHNWATDLTDPAGASLEILFPTEAYAVVGGKKYVLDLSAPAPAGFHMLSTLQSRAASPAGSLGGGGGGGAKKGGGPVGALAGKLAGLLGRRKGGGANAAAGGAGVNGTAAAPKAISTGALHDRLAPGGVAAA